MPASPSGVYSTETRTVPEMASTAVPQLPAVEVHLASGLDDPRDVRTVIRHDRLRCLLLGQRQLPRRPHRRRGWPFSIPVPWFALPFPAVGLMGTAAGARRRGGRCWRARPALRRLRRSRSAVTVCRDGPGYDPIRNSFRSRPLRALGDFHTTSAHPTSPFTQRRQQAQPQAISRTATRNISAPPPERWPRSGLPQPSARPRRSPAASTPPPLRNIRPTPLSHSHYIRPGTDGAGHSN